MNGYAWRTSGLTAFALLLGATTAVAQFGGGFIPMQWQLWKINADGSGLTRFADTPDYSCGSPKWSPDGTLVAYDTRHIDEDLIKSQIAVIRADGTGLERLGYGGMPSWSPDGTHLVFHTYDAPQKIIVMNVDGTGRETLLNHWGSPCWMPTGNRIALIGTNDSLAIFDLATGTERSILSGPHSIRPGFAVAPDGRQFCFGDETGGLALGTLDERTMQVTSHTVWQFGFCNHAAWSPDGKRIVFGWKKDVPGKKLVEDSLHQLFVLDTNGTTPPRPLPGQDRKRNNTNPDWSPDGKTIIFASQEPSPTQPEPLK